MSRARELLNEINIGQLKGANSWALDIFLRRGSDLKNLKSKIYKQIESVIEKELPLDEIRDYNKSLSNNSSALELTLLFHRNVEGGAIRRLVSKVVDKFDLYPWKE